ncbi:MAG TPA: hypothetical protein PKZ20_10205 [Rhodocyclaceae bacterium]|nr:hypothetical protein [Rhodocyclaceae bacterium]
MSSLFSGAMSTDAELAVLMTTYENVKPGDVLRYDKIAELIGAPYGSSRFRTVVDRFRRTLFVQRNIELNVIRQEGYRVAFAKERLENGVARASRAFKQTRRAAFQVAVIPDSELTTTDQARKTHVQVVLAKVITATSAAAKDIAPPRSIISHHEGNQP